MVLLETVADAEMLPALPGHVPGYCPTGSALLPSHGPSLRGDLRGKRHSGARLVLRGTVAAGSVGYLIAFFFEIVNLKS